MVLFLQERSFQLKRKNSKKIAIQQHLGITFQTATRTLTHS